MSIRLLVNKILILLTLLAVTGCGQNREENRDQDLVEVRQMLEIRDRAIENRDLALYRTILDPEYFDGGTSVEQILDELEAAFARFDKIEFTYQKSPVEFKMNSARVVQRVIYNVSGEEKGRYGHERLQLRKVDGKWLIKGGIQAGLLN